MASFELREPKKKPRYYKLIANVLVNGKIERRYGRFDFDPTELKNARARNAAAKVAAAEFERREQEKADKEAGNAGKTFAVVAQEYIESKKARLAPSARLEGDYDSHRNKANTTRGKENYLRKIQQFPEFAQKSVDSIKKVDCDWVLEQIEIGGARCRTHAVINQRGLEMKKESCPKLAKRCDCGAKTIEKAFRSEVVDIKTAEQVAIALGCKVDDAFDVETIAKPMTRKSMREYQRDIYARFLCFGNGALTSLYDHSDGFFRRQLILTTKDKPADRTDDPFLVEKMCAELEGILLWCLEGLHRLVQNDFRFTVSERAAANMDTIKRSSNNVIDFMESEGYFRFKADYSISSKEFYDIYKQWCEDNACHSVSAIRFSAELRQNDRRYNLEATNNIYLPGGRRVRGFVGIEPLVHPCP